MFRLKNISPFINRDHRVRYQPLDGRVALLNQAGIQTGLRADGRAACDSGIKRTERVAVASPVLVIALARRDEGQ